jgi:integrase
MTLKAFSDMYLKTRTGLTTRSREEHARTLKFLRQQLGAQRLVDEISPVDARRFIRWYADRMVDDEPVSPATVNKVLRECQRIFREAVECRLIRLNPFHGIRQQKVAPAEWHCVTPDEYQRLLDACRSDRWRGIVALAYCCGLRLGEIINLTWADIDFSEAVLRVVAKRGRGGTEAWTPKDKDARTVPIPKSVLGLLTRMQVEAAAGQVYVFVVPSGPSAGHRMPRQNFWRDFDALRRRAGLPPGSLHDLRKSYCTNLSGAVPLHVVQELAGHSDIRTTRRYYVKMQPEFIAAARAAVEAALEVQE